jgi:hypothetical protein
MSPAPENNKEALLKQVFRQLAKALNLRHPDGGLIEAAFEKLDSGAAGHAPEDRREVLINTRFLKADSNITCAVSVFLHECAHKLTEGHGHDFVFFVTNLSLHFRADDFLSSDDGELYRQTLDAAKHKRLPLWHFTKLYDAQNIADWPWQVVGEWLAEAVQLAERVYYTTLTPAEIVEVAQQTAHELQLNTLRRTAPRSLRATLWQLTPREWLLACITSASVGGALVAGAGIALLIAN